VPAGNYNIYVTFAVQQSPAAAFRPTSPIAGWFFQVASATPVHADMIVLT
jgi:hypothetical protein